MALFWSDVKTDPKRRFRFELAFTNKSNNELIPVWTIKTAMKPKANISTIEHQYIDHVFKYPGRVTWDPITITLVDPVEPDLAWQFLDVLGMSGYKYPTSSDRAKFSLSKKKFYDTIGTVVIHQIDDEGRSIEKWTLKNPFITSVDFGGSLDYAADDMNEITVEITFDWAQLDNTAAYPGVATAADT